MAAGRTLSVWGGQATGTPSPKSATVGRWLLSKDAAVSRIYRRILDPTLVVNPLDLGGSTVCKIRLSAGGSYHGEVVAPSFSDFLLYLLLLLK